MKNKLFIGLVAGGMTIAYFAFKYGNPVALFLLLAGLGVLSILIGIQMILTRRADILTGNYPEGGKEWYAILAAQHRGPRYIALGTMLLFTALGITIFRSGSVERIESFLDGTKGIGLFLAGAGLLMTVLGVIRINARNEAEREMKTAPFDRAEDAVLFLILGIGLLAFGVWVAVSPNTLREAWELIEYLIQKLPPD